MSAARYVFRRVITATAKLTAYFSMVLVVALVATLAVDALEPQPAKAGAPELPTTKSATAQQPSKWDKAALARVQKPPLGLPPVPIPADNPATLAKIALGRKLFFDRRLSANNTMSCAICHIPEQGFTNNELATAVGVEGRSVRRNSPTSYNVAYARTMFHDARDVSLETQIFGPLLAHREMANPSMGLLIAKISKLDNYSALFNRAFAAPPNVLNLGQALASYQRTLVSANSPFDRWKFGGDKQAMSAQAIAGYQLFIGKARCGGCHLIGERSALFTDHGLHNTGIGSARDLNDAQDGPPIDVEIAPGVTVKLARDVIRSVGDRPQKDFGRLEVTDNPDDLYRYKTPMLRNVELSAPYMHDGSLPTLKDVVQFYDRGGAPNPGLDPALEPLGLSPSEQESLVNFLRSLTGDNIAVLIMDARSIPVGN